MIELRPGVYLDRVGREITGRQAGYYVEVLDDTERPQGTGGYYVAIWNEIEGFDEWYLTADDLVRRFDTHPVEWLSEQDSETLTGRPHLGERSAAALELIERFNQRRAERQAEQGPSRAPDD
jgi:hypothetical protein